MTEPAPRNLIQKCAAVMAAVQHVPKRGRNSFHNYDYATEADIADAVRSAMAAQGVMLIPSVEKAEWREAQTKSGTERAVTLTVRYRLTDGAEAIEFVMLGEGQDRGDKATYKAMTGATKYALLKLFLISTGDDPEADDDEKPARGRASRSEPPHPPPAGPPPRPSTPAHVIHAFEVAKQIHGDKDAAAEPWKAALHAVIGTRAPASMTETEALNVESILHKGSDIQY